MRRKQQQNMLQLHFFHVYEWDEFRLFYWAMSYLRVIKTTNSAKARNDVVDMVYFLPECGYRVIGLFVKCC